MTWSKRTLASLMLVTALGSAGCGKVEGLADSLAAGLKTDGTQRPPMHGPGFRAPRGGMPFFFGADLNLTDEQKAQMKAIEEKYRPTPPDPTAGRALQDTLRQVLTAEVVNDEALRNALQNLADAKPNFQPPSPAAKMGEIRAVLTQAQIDTLVAKLKAAPKRPDMPPRDLPKDGEKTNRWAEKLNLNETQKAALDAFEAKMKAQRPEPPTGDPVDAQLTFWQTGNADALKLEPPARPTLPTEELLQLAKVLDLSQRKMILGRWMSPFGGRQRGHFGKPGFGPHGPGFPHS